MKNLMTKLKTLAALGMTMGLAFGAKADEPDYLTFTAVEANSTITVTCKNATQKICYSADGGASWTDCTTAAKGDGEVITLAAIGDAVKFKGEGVTTTSTKHFVMTGKIAASGDVGTLTNGKGGKDVTLDAEVYKNMFKDCTSLTVAPELPATNLAKNCYNGIFNGCKSLTVAPELPATRMEEECYAYMFRYCTSLVVNTNAPGKAWMIPAEAATSAASASNWNKSMFEGTPGDITNTTVTCGVTYYVASAPKAVLTVTPVTGASVTKVMEETWEVTGGPSYSVYQGNNVAVTYTADEGYKFSGGKAEFTTNVTASAAAMTVTLTADQQPIPRAPDYARDDGYDWLFNHAIAGKQCECEAAESSVDIFYVHPTLMTKVEPALQYEGFRLIDDPEIREMTIADWTSRVTSAYDAFWKNARCLADLGHVYAPFYRLATVANMNSQRNYSEVTNMIYHGYGYLDITNALETYFTKWNKGRKFILAGHGQSSATLMLALEHYFTQDDAHKQYLKNLVASYQIGFGVDREWIANLEKNTKTDGFDGVKFASTSNDVGVVISYNTTDEGGSGQSLLFPSVAIAINPISWTTTDAKAEASLNLGSLTNVNPDAVIAGLHGAKVNVTRGTVEADGFTEADWVEPETNIFGKKCLHNHDYKAFWENLRENNYVRAGKLAGFAKLSMSNLPDHVRVKGAKVDGADLTAVGGGYWATSSADSVDVVVTPKDENPAVVFANGEREMSLAMKCEGGAWVTVMSDEELEAATKTSDKPMVQLGIVAQRYPWNGTLDIQYKTPYYGASRKVTFYANDTEIGTAPGTGGKAATASFDLSAFDEFKAKALKDVKVRAVIGE